MEVFSSVIALVVIFIPLCCHNAFIAVSIVVVIIYVNVNIVVRYSNLWFLKFVMITMITMIGLQVHMSRKHAMIEQLDGNISLPHDVGMPLEDQFNEDTVRQWSYFTLVLFSNGVCLYTASQTYSVEEMEHYIQTGYIKDAFPFIEAIYFFSLIIDTIFNV